MDGRTERRVKEGAPMQTTEILRTEVKFRFIDYLKATQVPYYEPSLTVCPHCGQHAQVVGDFLWNCPNYGSKGDVADYAIFVILL